LAFWLAAFSLLAMAWAIRGGNAGSMPAGLRGRLRLAALALALVVVAAGIGCNDYNYGPSIGPGVSGTPSGTYTITITGTLGNNSSVTRSTTVNLAVGS